MDEATNAAPEQPGNPKKTSTSKQLISIIAAIVILGGAYFALPYLKQNAQPDREPAQNESTNNDDGATNDNPDTTKPPVDENSPAIEISDQDWGIKWLQKPQKLGDLKLFPFPPESGQEVNYYKIAEIEDGGQLVYAGVQEMGVSAYRFKKDASGKYTLLKNHSAEGYEVNANVAIDSTSKLVSLVAPDAFTLNGLELTRGWSFQNGIFLDNDFLKQTGTVKVGSISIGDVYKVLSPFETALENGSTMGKQYVLVLSDTTLQFYMDKKDFLADDSTLIATLNADGTKFKDKTFSIGYIRGGCGSTGGDQIISPLSTDRLQVIGTAPSGKKLYTFVAPDDSIVKNAYDAYNIGRDYPGNPEKTLTFDEFAGEKPLLLWQDAASDFLVFMRTDFGPLAECGKPVVYLYPTASTSVSVKVGANIEVSEPDYGQGWYVTAEPNGQLTNADGQVYPNLFWEGQGWGIYPEIAAGRIVDRTNIESELRADLALQGLNTKESQDFLDFWLPKMPDSKFIRLTWLTTAEMNELAPLDIRPKPQTVIRVFLDFVGQDTAESHLAPQRLVPTARNGFTVIEWGGLKIDK